MNRIFGVKSKYFKSKMVCRLVFWPFERHRKGYEINFTKYFYQYKPLRSLRDITSDLLELEKESEGIFKEIVNE